MASYNPPPFPLIPSIPSKIPSKTIYARQPLLSVENLGIQFGPPNDPVKAVDGISFYMERQAKRWPWWARAAAAKASTALGLDASAWLRRPPAMFPARLSLMAGTFCTLPENQLRSLRGNQIAYIFQEPGSSLNPGLHHRLSNSAKRSSCIGPRCATSRAEIVSALERVGIRDPARNA